MAGIKLTHGGTYDNTGTITGNDIYGIEIYGGVGHVNNSGSITSAGAGVVIEDGGSVANKAGGSISGGGAVAGIGVLLDDGGSVSNAAGATIQGYSGVAVRGAVGTVTNAGSIKQTGVGPSYAVSLENGGSVTNSGTITGEIVFNTALAAASVAESVTNSGTITGRVGFEGSGACTLTNLRTITGSVGFYGSGSGPGKVTNSATITGSVSFMGSGSGADSLANSGTIGGGIFEGSSADTVTNTGTISGGITLFGAATVTNSGTIGGAIDFAGSGANTLTLQTGSVIDGSVQGSVEAGATNALVLTGSGSASNTFESFDTLLVKASGTWTLGSSEMIGATTVSTGTLAIADLVTTMTEASAGTVTIGSGDTLTLNGASTLRGTVAGLGTLALTAGATTFASGAKLTVSNWSVQGASATIGAALTYAGALTAEDSALIALSGGALLLSGAVDFNNATMSGAHTVTDTGTTTVSGLTIANTAGFIDQGFLTQDGEVTLGDAQGDASLITIAKAATWDIAGYDGIALGSSKALSIDNNGLFETTGGADVSIAPAFVNAGSVQVSSGTLDFQGAYTGAGTETISNGGTLELSGASTLRGAVSGLGTLLLSAGATTFASGAKLTVNDWSMQDASATIGTALSYAGGFTAEDDVLITLSGGALLLAGSVDFNGVTTAGAQALTDSGSTTVFGLTVGNTAGFTDRGFLTQDGEVTLGDANGDASLITIATSGTWDIAGDLGIDLGSSGALSIHNNGTFEKTSGANVSAIAPAFVNNGEVLVSSGTLDFQGVVTGTGTDVISSVIAALEFDSSVAKTQTIDFLRPDGVLFLGSPMSFSGVLNGFDTIFTNDAVEMVGSWSIKGYTQTSSTEGTLTLSEGSQSASIAFDGNYSKTGFQSYASGGQTIVAYH